MKVSSAQAACMVWGLHLYHLQCEWPPEPTSQASLQGLSRSHVHSKAVFFRSEQRKKQRGAQPTGAQRQDAMSPHPCHALRRAGRF